MCVLFSAYADIRFETAGTFRVGDVLLGSHSYREFTGYVAVARDSTIQLNVDFARPLIVAVIL